MEELNDTSGSIFNITAPSFRNDENEEDKGEDVNNNNANDDNTDSREFEDAIEQEDEPLEEPSEVREAEGEDEMKTPPREDQTGIYFIPKASFVYTPPSSAKKRRYVPEEDIPDSTSMSEDKYQLDYFKQTIFILEQDVTSARDKATRSQAALIEAENNVLRLKSTIIDLERSSEEKSFQTKVEIERQQSMQEQIEFLLKEQAEFKKKITQRDEKIKRYEEERIQLRREKIGDLSVDEISMEKDELQERLHTIKVKHAAQLSELNSRVATYREQVDLLQKKLKENKEKNGNLEILQQELEVEKARNAELQAQSIETEEAKVIINSMKDEMNRHREMEGEYRRSISEFKKMKAVHTNSEALQEKIRNLEGLNAKLPTLEARLFETQTEVERLRAEKQKWMSFFSQLKDHEIFNLSPEGIASRILQMEKEVELLTDRVNNLTSDLKVSESGRNTAEAQVVQLQKARVEVTNQLGLMRESVKRQEAVCSAVMSQKEGLQRILDSYDKEDETDPTHEAQRMNRLKVAEKTITEKEEQIKSLITLLNSQGTNVKGEELEGELFGGLRAENAKLNKEIQKLIDEIAALEARVGKGEFDSTKTKVLHMTMNPSSMADKNELDQLRKQVEELRSQLGGEPQKVQDNAKQTEQIQQLTRQLKEETIKYQKLKKVAQNKISEVQDLTKDLFGYSVYPIDNKRYKLTSKYASKEDEILFDHSKGQLALLETEFVSSLGAEISGYLSKCHSIPAFLSHITLELFNAKTFHPQ
ncbi:hypothetical protein PROFUN_08649 [Planoprotostelium fungivorum]|uniref:Mitotic spindle assembly checkpoint protein MAD1 n=1 Tax=Planoprotostelium fungivorum TaxID=1890364 RepID=A0A2P6NJ31_9EUKA|nr:hypothetical protein PROFUN_08649 [Planoprotostelium fungivorum]